jgi:uncharacterized protein (DUF433 family)
MIWSVEVMDMNNVIRLSDALYQAVTREAAVRQRTPDEFAEELLARHLLPQHPHVEVVESRSGPRAVVRGTRVGVDVVVGYERAGYTPQQIVDDILPHLTLAQVYDALSYFHEHLDEIEGALSSRAVEAWQKQMRERLGDTTYARLTGGTADA